MLVLARRDAKKTNPRACGCKESPVLYVTPPHILTLCFNGISVQHGQTTFRVLTTDHSLTMSNALRFFSRHGRSLSQSSKIHPPALGRSFHSPFVVLNSPLTSPPTSTSNVSPMSAPLYEKQDDHSPEPQVSSAGTLTYVVSEPDPANTPYAIPYGAYPTSAPYVNFKSTSEAPNPEGKHSSTSTSSPHLFTTRAVPHNAAGVGESAAVRYREAPGEMGRRGGSYGGLGLMDESSMHQQGAVELPDRNSSPDSDAAARLVQSKERK